MDGNIELLNYIYQNSKMGVETTSKMMDVVDDEKLKKCLIGELEQYKKVSVAAERMINEKGHKEKDVGGITKMSVNMAMNMKTMRDKTPSHIAEIMIQGNTMGTIGTTKNINKYGNAENHIMDLAKRLLKIEEYNIEELKKFLGTNEQSFH